MTVEGRSVQDEAQFRVGRRSLLIGDRVYQEGEAVTAEEAGNHLRQLLRTRQLLPMDPNIQLPRRSKRGFAAWIRSLLRR